MALLESERPEIVLTDLEMPRVDGMQIPARARELDPDVVGKGPARAAVCPPAPARELAEPEAE